MTSPAGLTSREARRRLEEFGLNAVAEDTRVLGRPCHGYWKPQSSSRDGSASMSKRPWVGGLLAFNAILGVLQEGRASAAPAALEQRLAPTALVRRDGEWIRRPAADVVPGDAIRLALGAVVPADARIVSGSVMVDQSRSS
jgi:H+-transporting ATPase